MTEKLRGEIPQNEKTHFPERKAEELEQRYDTLMGELDDILNPRHTNPSEFWGYDANEVDHPFTSQVSHWEGLSNENDEFFRSKADRLKRLKELFDAKTQEMSQVIGELAQLARDTAEKREQDKT